MNLGCCISFFVDKEGAAEWWEVWQIQFIGTLKSRIWKDQKAAANPEWATGHPQGRPFCYRLCRGTASERHCPSGENRQAVAPQVVLWWRQGCRTQNWVASSFKTMASKPSDLQPQLVKAHGRDRNNAKHDITADSQRAFRRGNVWVRHIVHALQCLFFPPFSDQPSR